MESGRSLVSLLVCVAAMVFGFVAYHEWMRPPAIGSIHVSPPSPPSQPVSPISQSQPSPSLSPLPGTLPPSVPPREIAIMGGVTGPGVEALSQIQVLLTQGREAEAEQQLENVQRAVLANPDARTAIAVLWNNLGAIRVTRGEKAAALRAFKVASELDGGNPTVQLNVAQAYRDAGDPALTPELLTRLIALAPQEPFPHIALAELLVDRDQLALAGQHLAQAAATAKVSPVEQTYLLTVTAKVKRAEVSEQGLATRASSHFLVKFDGAEDYETWMSVLDILEEAYREIGQALGHFPSKPIPVVLLTTQRFHAEAGGPAWADGLYEAFPSRIRLPSHGALTDRARLIQVLRHEFVHAALADYLGPSLSALPTWMNEGLAMALEGPAKPEVERLLEALGQAPLIPLTRLEGGWTGFSAETARQAYLEGYGATRYLIDRAGMGRIREVLASLKQERSMGLALERTLAISYAQFQQQWAEQVQDKSRQPSS